LRRLIETLTPAKSNIATTQDNAIEETIRVGCRASYVGVLATDDESLVISFKHGEEKDIYISDAVRLIKDSARKKNAKQFVDGTFYFCNESDYRRFKIRKNLDLSDEALCELVLNGTPDEVVVKLIKIADKNDIGKMDVRQTFIYGITRILKEKPQMLKNWSYESRAAVEKYLGLRFDEKQSDIDVINILQN
jgi:hypothetical protein